MSRCSVEFGSFITANRGFSIVEVLSTCNVNWGMSPIEAMERLRKDMIPYYPLGVYKDITATEEDK